MLNVDEAQAFAERSSTSWYFGDTATFQRQCVYTYVFACKNKNERRETFGGPLSFQGGGSTLTRATNNNNNIKNKLKGEKSRKASSET